MPDPRLCLICRRVESDAIHGPPRKPFKQHVGIALEHHSFDPGERRKLVRRMDDRVKLLEDVARRV